MDFRRTVPRIRLAALLVMTSLITGQSSWAQETRSPEKPPSPEQATPAVTETSTPLSVKPLTKDADIASRLSRILKATEVLDDVAVRVNEGVVFLEGTAKTDNDREMARQIASKLEDVVGVVNYIHVQERALVDLGPAWKQMRDILRSTIQNTPLILLAIALLAVLWLVSSTTSRLVRRIVDRRSRNRLVRNLAGRAVTIPFVVIGIYMILRIVGLDQAATTLLSGTGLIGLVVGIAFRDIAENFLAGILISTQRPFSIGDIIEINGTQGVVQSVSTRGTLLMSLEGNHIHFPNSIVYKAVIKNLSANPRQRLSFTIPVRATESASAAQAAIYQVLKSHEAVLSDPEPMVLLDQMSTAIIVLRVYFWIDTLQNSGLKVLSSIMRLSKQTLDEIQSQNKRILASPGSVHPGTGSSSSPAATETSTVSAPTVRTTPPPESTRVSIVAEGRLVSEQASIKQQARESRLPDAGANLIEEPKTEQPVTAP